MGVPRHGVDCRARTPRDKVRTCRSGRGYSAERLPVSCEDFAEDAGGTRTKKRMRDIAHGGGYPSSQEQQRQRLAEQRICRYPKTTLVTDNTTLRRWKSTLIDLIEFALRDRKPTTVGVAAAERAFPRLSRSTTPAASSPANGYTVAQRSQARLPLKRSSC